MDDRLDPSSDLEICQHAESCEPCRSDLRNYQLVLRVFPRQLKSPPVRTPSLGRRRMPTRLGLAAAATLLIAVSISSLPDTPTQTPTAISASVILRPAVEPEPTSVVSANVPRGGNFVQPILGLSLVANADWSRLQTVEMPFGVPVPQVETEWIGAVADEMVPIKQSVDSTFNLIMRTLST